LNEQEGGNPITFSKVFDVQNKPKEVLFSSLIQTLSVVFNSLKDILQVEDKNQGIIILKPKMKFDITGLGLTGYSGLMSYTLKIQVKDNKYKIDIMDLFYEGNFQYPETKLGEFTDREKFAEKGYMVPQKNKVWTQLKDQVPVRFEGLIDSINKKLIQNQPEDFQP
jgi:hypothetical protein